MNDRLEHLCPDPAKIWAMESVEAMTPGADVVDLGSGVGHLLNELVATNKFHFFTAVEKEDFAGYYDPAVRFIRGDILEFIAQDQEWPIDLIIMVNVFDRLELDDARLVMEIIGHRLGVDGVAIISLPLASDDPALLESKTKLGNDYWKQSEFNALLRKCGLAVVDSQLDGLGHHVFKLRKST